MGGYSFSFMVLLPFPVSYFCHGLIYIVRKPVIPVPEYTVPDYTVRILAFS